jgi:UDPglucose 6-dehydrogenase
MKIAIVGSGYVGLVTGACLASAGHDVCCVDRSPERVAQIARGEPPFHEAGLPQLLRQTLASGRLTASTSLPGAVAASDLTIVAVGTPPRGEAPDLSFIEAAATEIGGALRGSSRYHVVVVKSTVPPGTTEMVGDRIAAESGLGAEDFGVCMNPEFLREGCAVSDFLNPDRIVIGERDERSGAVVANVYASFECPKLHTTLRTAELIKYTSNALLALLVSFSNEVSAVCEALPDASADAVMAGVHLDRRLSPMTESGRIRPGILEFLRAGVGFGGSCLPKDVNAFRVFAQHLDVETPLMNATMHVNAQRPARVVERLAELVGGLSGRTVALLGLAFKPGTDDTRDSPSLTLLRALRARGASVRVYDPLVRDDVAPLLEASDAVRASGAEDALTNADAALIATAWPVFAEWDWTALCRVMRRPVILDGRGVLAHVRLPAGVVYQPIGQRRPGQIGEPVHHVGLERVAADSRGSTK